MNYFVNISNAILTKNESEYIIMDSILFFENMENSYSCTLDSPVQEYREFPKDFEAVKALG